MDSQFLAAISDSKHWQGSPHLLTETLNSNEKDRYFPKKSFVTQSQISETEEKKCIQTCFVNFGELIQLKEERNSTLIMWHCEFGLQLNFFYQYKFIYEYKTARVEKIHLPT